jgi:hypothetical protein
MQVEWIGEPCDGRQLEAAVIRPLAARGEGGRKGKTEQTEQNGDRDGERRKKKRGAGYRSFV